MICNPKYMEYGQHLASISRLLTLTPLHMSIFCNRQRAEGEMNECALNENQILVARLLFDEEPTINDELIEKELHVLFQNFEAALTDELYENSRQYFFHDYMVQYLDEQLPSQCSIFTSKTPCYINECLQTAYHQAGHWPEIRQETKNCRYELILNDLMSKPLHYKQRVELFQKFVCAVSRALQPTAIYFPTSEKMVKPSAYLSEVLIDGKDWLYGLLNVRTYNMQEGGLLMDTVGLHGIGLPDFQLQFMDLNPNEVASYLHAYARYIYEQGPVIKDGNTVEGIDPYTKWKCRLDTAFVNPPRNVIEILEP